MPDWRNSLIPPDASIRDAANTINDGGFEIGLVVDGEGRLQGTITDGDVRRGLLRGLRMDSPVGEIMFREPQVASPDLGRKSLLERMNASQLRQMPLLDEANRVVGLTHIRTLTEPMRSRENWVVLMAGGMGKRLRPLTEKMPKPLLTVGDKPLLQTILESFVEQNFRQFYFSVNYRGDAIKEHFGDGGKWNVDIGTNSMVASGSAVIGEGAPGHNVAGEPAREG